MTQSEIAQAIRFSQSTISKELCRNHGERGYRPARAERLAIKRKSGKRTRPEVMVGIIRGEVKARLGIKHSPDQISKSLALRDLKVSHETIYRYLAQCLPIAPHRDRPINRVRRDPTDGRLKWGRVRHLELNNR